MNLYYAVGELVSNRTILSVSINDTFESLRVATNKQFLNGKWGRAYQSTLGRLMDESLNRVVQARVARLPSFCPEDGLQYIASERQLERAIGETITDYREVLRTAWSIWATAGSAQAHVSSLGRMGFGSVQVKRRHDFNGVPDEHPYVRAFARDVWAQFDVVCQKPMPWQMRYWGAGVWGAGVWGFSAQVAQVDQMKRFLRLFRAGHDTPTYVYLNFGSGQLWGVGNWGKGLWGGNGVSTRLLVGEDHWLQRGLI